MDYKQQALLYIETQNIIHTLKYFKVDPYSMSDWRKNTDKMNKAVDKSFRLVSEGIKITIQYLKQNLYEKIMCFRITDKKLSRKNDNMGERDSI